MENLTPIELLVLKKFQEVFGKKHGSIHISFDDGRIVAIDLNHKVDREEILKAQPTKK